MLTLDGYDIFKAHPLKNGVKRYDARHLASGRRVMIHFLPVQASSADFLHRIFAYFLPLKKIHAPHLARVYAIEKISKPSITGIAFVQETLSGVPLTVHIRKNGPLKMAAFIPSAIQMVSAVNALHKAGLTHHWLTSDVFFVDPETHDICLGDFAFGMIFNQPPLISDISGTSPPAISDRFLPYISPEQTGRMNCDVDYRTDFYSLGVIFHELLLGAPPFTGSPVEIIHAHMARPPEIPTAVRKNMGDFPADMILKLLSKSPDARYQSAWGIKSDLEKCRNSTAWADPDIPPTPGADDAPEQFRFTGAIYGRDVETAMLVHEFNQMRETRPGVFMVAGYSGIGKTRLVEELRRHVAAGGGYFISSQCDPLEQELPYSSLIPAFSGMLRQMLTEPLDRIEDWRLRLTHAMGDGAAVMMEVLPELENIIGSQPAAPSLTPRDARNRFHVVFENFLHTLATRAHPLALFIDNIQWADAATLKLMTSLFTGSDMRYFFLVGAYRTNELTPEHPLLDSLEHIRDKGVPVQTLTLKPLSEADVCRMLADSLHTSMDQVVLPARVIHDKTRGNPFFIRQFIETVNAAGCFSYDYNTGRWQWDIDQVTDQRITDNVVDYMTARVAQLGACAMETLWLAACIGDVFAFSLLAAAAEKPADEILVDLREAAALGLILPKGDAWQRMDHPAREMTFAFVHDKLRQTVYARISDALKHQYHHTIGNRMFQQTDVQNLPSRIFAIVHHLNQGKSRITSEAEKKSTARLNLLAAKRAKDAAAYHQARQYLKTAEKFLTPAAWDTDVDLMFDIKKHRMECEYLLHQFDPADGLFHELLAHADSDETRADLFNQKMIMLASLARHEDALAMGAAGLDLLGIHLPKKAGKTDILRRLMVLKYQLRGKEIASLVDLPEISDPRLQRTLTLMMNLSLSAYFRHPYFASCLALDIFKLTLKHGNSPVSPFAYVIYGAALCGLFREYTAGCRFGELAIKAKNRFGGPQMQAKVMLYVANAMTVWTRPLRQVITMNREGLTAARNSGDLNYTIYHIQTLIFTMFAAGTPLNEVDRECRRYFEFVEKTHDQGALNYLISVIQFIKCLRGETCHIHSLNDDRFSESRHVRRIQDDNIHIILCRHHLLKLRLLYIMEDYKGALKEAEKCRALRQYHIGTIILPEYYLYHALVLTALYPSVSAFKKSIYRAHLGIFRRHLRHLAGQCPENFEAKYFLIQAEMARIAGRDRRASAFYQKAIEAANTGGFTQIHAIASEAAARFFLSRKMDDAARPYQHQARSSYHKWGARTKATLLEKTFSLPAAADSPAGPLPMGSNLDYSAIVASLQAISREIVLEDLMKSLMKIVLENAGARKVRFLSIKSGQMFLEASTHIDEPETLVHKSLPADGHPDLFHPVLNYVKRASTYLVLEDAVNKGDFITHPYVKTHRPRSVLCLPVIRHQWTGALLYLENDITPSVFTPERIRVLGLLASQAAISMENARLYENVIQNEKQLREISEKREEESLRYQSQLRSLSSELSLAEERERRRIATDLHDRIGHALANASMKLQLVKNAASPETAARHMDDIHGLIDQSITDTQNLTFELSPPILYDLGLEAALDWLAEQTQQQHDITVEFTDDLSYKPIDESLRILLFQAARELLHNVVKHARAERVTVAISREENHVRIAIDDNGVGFAATRHENDVKKGGFGIFSIQERLKHQGGRMDIASDPETGSRITIVSPLTAKTPIR